ncbi:MAG: hypothetical protein HYZ42_15005, partial [Bacteroidetes bacterium]|nr:hypothetical protein [Bacteroidota bacterium]
ATGNSYSNLLMGIDGKIEVNQIDTEIFDPKVTSFVRDYLVFGNKVVYTAKFNQDQMDLILDKINSKLDFSQNAEDLENLNVLTESELKRTPADRSVFKSKFNIDGTICLLFSSRHFVEKRVPLSVASLRNNDHSVDHVFGVKQMDYQSFDSVIIHPDTKTVDFCIDNCQGLSQKIHFKYFNELRGVFISMFEFEFEDFRLTRNYFKLVKGYYNSTIGVVSEIEFRTETGSTKKETMDANSIDLRRERFHSSGAAVVEIVPFSIEMELKNTVSRNVIKHSIPGRPQILSTSIPEISFYIVSGALNHSDYTFVKNNVDTVLQQGN